MHDWIGALLAARDRAEPACLVTVAHVRGSAPREAGARMIVTATESYGTIGGGELEYQCIRLAAEQLRSNPPDKLQPKPVLRRRFALGSNCGQCCGGAVTVLFEPTATTHGGWIDALRRAFTNVRPFVLVAGTDGTRGVIAGDCAELFGSRDPRALTAQARSLLQASTPLRWLEREPGALLMQRIAASDFRVAVFGAGHVGSATVAALAPLDCTLRWIDGRRDIFPHAVPRNVTAIASADPARDVLAMPVGAYYLVMTHSHALDFDITAAILGRGDAAYCGLIGSRSKRRRFERLMRAQGMNTDCLSRLVCPIGIDTIRGKRPAEIAVSVAAELLQVRCRREALAEHRASENTTGKTNERSWKPISLSG